MYPIPIIITNSNVGAVGEGWVGEVVHNRDS
jgi:hypothetical protein